LRLLGRRVPARLPFCSLANIVYKQSPRRSAILLRLGTGPGHPSLVRSAARSSTGASCSDASPNGPFSPSGSPSNTSGSPPQTPGNRSEPTGLVFRYQFIIFRDLILLILNVVPKEPRPMLSTALRHRVHYIDCRYLEKGRGRRSYPTRSRLRVSDDNTDRPQRQGTQDSHGLFWTGYRRPL